MARTNVNAQGLSSVKGLYEKRGWFYYQPSTPKGAGIPRPKAVALKTRSLMVALELMEHRRFDMEVIRSVKAGTLEEVLPAYHLEKAGDAKHSRRGRQCVLEMFMNHAGNPRVDQITPAMIQAWRKHLTEKGGQRGVPIAHTTMSSYSIVLRAFLNWAVAKGMLTSNPMQRIAIRVNSTRVQEFLTEDEREKLLAAECSDRVSLILYLGFFAGLRSGEMLAMSPNWLWIAEDGGRGTITVQNTPIKMSDGKPGMWQPKGRRCRTVARRTNHGGSERDKLWRLDVILCAQEVDFRFGSGRSVPKRGLRRRPGWPHAEPGIFRRRWLLRWMRGLGQGLGGCGPDGWWWHHSGRHRARRLGPEG